MTPTDPAAPSASRPGPDPTRLGEVVLDLYRIKQGEMLAAVIHLGNRLGLWSALAARPGSDPAALAEHTGLQERWVREWLHAVAAADLVVHEAGRFTLPPELEAALVDTAHPAHMAGVFGPPLTHREVDRTAEAFRTGVGMTWDEHGEHTCHIQTAMGAGLQQSVFVPVVLGAVAGLPERLRSGATVVDVGCGSGVAACAVARAFPASTVVGLDPSGHAIEAARRRSADLANVTFRTGTFDDLEGLDPDLVVTIDVLHDLPRPLEAMRAVRAALADDGVWLVADIRSRGDLEANRVIPVAPLMYAMSVFYCLSSSLSEPGGAGLGTLGLDADTFRSLAAEAGFSSVAVHEHDVDPTNRYYEVRP